MKISLIVPVHNGDSHLSHCLAAIYTSSRLPDELIIVDDGSSDTSASVAAQYNATVLSTNQGPRGPAHARNVGARAATGDVLLFVDSDVAVHPDTIARVTARLDDETLDGIFGSYDERPKFRSLVSLYKNLQHHWVHQHSAQETHTFWAGCGAIRRQAFEAVGGYDETFPRPSIEDIELGLRLSDEGYHLELDRDVLATHLKRWRIGSLLRADIWGRAVPWSKLIAERGDLPRELNLGLTARLSGFLAWAMLLTLLLALAWPPALPLSAAALIATLWLNRHFYRFLWHRGGLALLFVGIGLHLLYYLYATAAFVCNAAPALLIRRPQAIKRAQS